MTVVQALTPLTIGRSHVRGALLGALWGFGHSIGQLILGLLMVLLKVRLLSLACFVLSAPGQVPVLMPAWKGVGSRCGKRLANGIVNSQLLSCISSGGHGMACRQALCQLSRHTLSYKYLHAQLIPGTQRV